jgi:flagellar protein FliO/FliZ
VDALFLLLRVVLALAAVLGIIWYIKRRLGGSGQTGPLLTVVTRRAVGQKASVAVVDFDGRRLLLGVTDSAVNVLIDGPMPKGDADFSKALERASDGDNKPADGEEPLAGSIFSKNTWKQFAVAVNNGGNK